VVHAIKWLLQHRYMQIEGMAELTPPLIDADPAKLPSVDAPLSAREKLGIALVRGRMLSSVRPSMRQ
jgi:hypothetical protein